MAIIISINGNDRTKVDPTVFEKEVDLQTLISENPSCIPVDEIDEEKRLMVVGREIKTGGGPLETRGMVVGTESLRPRTSENGRSDRIESG